MLTIIMTPTPESSNVEAIGYNNDPDGVGGDIYVKFKSGGTYRYLGVPHGVYRNFCAAESKGTYLNQKLKSRFISEKVTEGEVDFAFVPEGKFRKKKPVLAGNADPQWNW